MPGYFILGCQNVECDWCHCRAQFKIDCACAYTFGAVCTSSVYVQFLPSVHALPVIISYRKSVTKLLDGRSVEVVSGN